MWFAQHTAKLSEEQRRHFYEVLAHNLTVAIRAVWSTVGISDAEKVERMKWVNELLHRVTAKVYSQRLSPGAWTEEDFGDMVQAYIQSDKGIGPEVEQAVRYSYRVVTGEEMGQRLIGCRSCPSRHLSFEGARGSRVACRLNPNCLGIAEDERPAEGQGNSSRTE